MGATLESAPLFSLAATQALTPPSVFQSQYNPRARCCLINQALADRADKSRQLRVRVYGFVDENICNPAGSQNVQLLISQQYSNTAEWVVLL